ncbi:MAG TPA: uroporphyrinogen decarboxylase family protein [Bacteroidota bacterium]|nr:uroporphyrinogen decarboxylase family protein [Bacteroidota bacterium]
MRGLSLPLDHPAPDGGEFINILAGKSSSGRVPLVEYIVDEVVMKPVVEEMLGRRWVRGGKERDAQRASLDNFIQFWYRMGYDFVRYEESLPFPERKLFGPDPAPQSSGERAWANEHEGAIMSWDDFERYPWPSVDEFDFFPFEYLSRNLPEGMGLIACHGGGVFEHLSWIMSIEGLSVALHDDPGLVRATADRLGEIMMGFYRHILDLDGLIAVFPGDDMGYKRATLVAPDILRRYVLPWHARFAALAHAKKLPYYLHSCGRVDAVMEDLITGVGIDGKHSFEDGIVPVQDFQARYGDRIAVLGGIDINILAGGSPDDVRAKTHRLMNSCGARGRYAVGSGNSVPSYVPLENYLVMIDEAHRSNRERTSQ